MSDRIAFGQDVSLALNLRAVQLLLGHGKLASTARYLGIEVDDALEVAQQTEVSQGSRSATGFRTLTGSVGPVSRTSRCG